MRICTAQQMRDLERDVIDRVGVPSLSLMEVAGRGVVEVCAAIGRRRTVVLCGPGNNGGDGFVIARLLHGRGWPVRALALFTADKAAPDCAAMERAAHASGVSVTHAPAATEFDAAWGDAELIVDALLGTGLGRVVAPDGVIGHAIAAVNRSGAVKVAVDLPSGLDADRGVALGLVVSADHTVTFGLPKIGLVSSPGFLHVGRLHVVDIGLPRARVDALPTELLDGEILEPVKTADPRDHKGTHGHVLVYAGALGKCGAALLCATAAQRSGAGLVTMLAPYTLRHALQGHTLALMQHFFADPPDDGALAQLLDGKRALAVGPGLDGNDATTVDLLRRLLAAPVRAAVDAEALNLVAQDGSLLQPGAERVLLPHPGEAARLMGISSAEVEADRVTVARTLAQRYGAVVALKGARTIVAAPDGKMAICPTGGPALGTGGSGDVLCGMVAALLARTPALSAFAAACAAVFWHGRAGDQLAVRSPIFIADDLLSALPTALVGD